ncbi:ATP-binding protein [Sphingomonas sp.]|uniref:sensor histidine kinase n=1 Tax=Sphingomonas sp. TaxID=28214 RepID=UPI003CC68A50
MTAFTRSAAYRIAFAYSAAFALAILLLGTAVYFAADHEFRRQRDVAISAETGRMAGLGDPAAMARDIELRSRTHAREGFLYALFNPHGRRVAGGLDTRVPAPGRADIVFRDGGDPADTARAETVALAAGWRLTVGVDAEPVERINETILLLFGIAFAAVMAVGVIGALLLGGYLRRRLSSISDTAAAIVGGELHWRVPVSERGDEFDAVGLAVNAMLERIGQLMDSLRQVSADVAHDLRTPLVRLRAQLALVGVEEGAAERALEQGDQLLAMFAAVLRIAEVEGGTALIKAPVDLGRTVLDVAEAYQPAFSDVGQTLHWAIAADAVVSGDEQLLAQALVNLLDNARIHTPLGTNVRIELSTDAEQVVLSVIDDGPGVPAGDQTRILERFARSEASRTTPGHGLGLNLVAAIVAAHGGEMAVADAAPGLRITITLPRISS